MEPAKSAEVTGLLKAWSSGDQTALDRLTAVVHGELRRIARRYMRNERPGNTLQSHGAGRTRSTSDWWT